MLSKQKKKIGIITLNGYYNYGNRLQNYATEQILKSLGFEVKTIINNTSTIRKTKNNSLSNRLKRISRMDSKELVKKIKTRFKYYANKKKIDNYKKEKRNLFKEFSEEYLNETDYKISKNNIPNNINNEFDYFVTGSDQVWNPFNVRRHSSINFLTFAPKRKRIAFAPSFGVSYIPDEDKDDFRSWISDMASLSVRENEGAQIIKNLTGRNAEVLLDPTMILDREEWYSISVPINNNKNYLLTYILGEISRSKRKKIFDFANTNNLEIIDLAMGPSDWSDTIVAPREYLSYIKNASAVFTDSFHGTIFSILFERPFVTYKRKGSSESMLSRINTLLSKFEFESRIEDNIGDLEKVFEIKFSHIESILKVEKNKFIEYLNQSFNLKR